jgi:ferritin
MIHAEEEKEVRTRLREIVLQNGEPATRDIVLLSLIQACGLMDEVFCKEERQKYSERINTIARLTTIGQEVHNEVQDFLEWYLMTQMQDNYYH